MRMILALAVLGFLAAGATAQDSDGATLIFFDWGKSELTSDATATLDKVAERYRQTPGPLTLDGHSDRSGAAGGNVGASRRRAQAARDYLVGHGVPAGVIAVRAYGEASPIIATADGVREVQNRRVEIRFGEPR